MGFALARPRRSTTIVATSRVTCEREVLDHRRVASRLLDWRSHRVSASPADAFDLLVDFGVPRIFSLDRIVSWQARTRRDCAVDPASSYAACPPAICRAPSCTGTRGRSGRIGRACRIRAGLVPKVCRIAGAAGIVARVIEACGIGGARDTIYSGATSAGRTCFRGTATCRTSRGAACSAGRSTAARSAATPAPALRERVYRHQHQSDREKKSSGIGNSHRTLL
jgi:hypothetical protein